MGSLLSMGYRSGVSSIVKDPQIPLATSSAVHDSIAGAVAAAGSAPEPLRSQILDTAGSAYANGMSTAFVVATVLGVAAAFIVHRTHVLPAPDAAPNPEVLSTA